MKRKAPYLFLLLFMLSACSRYAYLRSKSDIKSSGFSVTQKFDFSSRLIILPITINGKVFHMAFDTGASSTILSQKVAEQLKLEPKGKATTRDSRGNVQKLDMVLLNSVSISGVEFTGILATVIKWPKNSTVECLVPDGIIGNNLIRHANWLIDYKDSTITISDGNLHTEGMITVPMKYPEYRPYLDITIDTIEVDDILLDLGSTGSLDISKKKFKKLGLKPVFDEFPHFKKIDGSTQGLFGHKVDSVDTYQIPQLKIGKLEILKAQAEVEVKSKIGNALLKKTQLLLDYEKERIGFLPYDSVTEIEYLKRFDFHPSVSGDSIYIASLIKNGKAWKKGLRYGQRIEIKSLPDVTGDYCDFVNFLLTQYHQLDSLNLSLPKNTDSIYTFYPTDVWKN